MTGKVLIVDDEPQMRLAMRRVLSRAGYTVEEARDGLEGADKLGVTHYPVIVSDVRMPRLDGLGFLGRAREISPRSAVIMITAYGTVESAVEAVRRGARDYILKPFPPEVLERAVGQAFASAASAEADTKEPHATTLRGDAPVTGSESEAARSGGEDGSAGTAGGRDFLTSDPAMRTLLERARLAADSEATILVEAESGAGKELLSRFIHAASRRREGPFRALNCAAFPNELLESELFGHARGAFTGAVRERRGHIEAAAGGTLLLDEIGEMSPALQAKLLRVLQEREVLRLGEETPRRVDVRVIASTNRDLAAAVRSGSFRDDLYFRLSVIPLRIPPLRERPADVPILVEHFCRIYGKDRGTFRIAPAALARLRSHPWPGNVRELENVVHRAVVLAKGGELVVEDFFPGEGAGPEVAASAQGPASSRTAPDIRGRTIEEAERLLIEDALRQTGGNRTRAAAIVGISVRTMRNKLREYRTLDTRQELPGHA